MRQATARPFAARRASRRLNRGQKAPSILFLPRPSLETGRVGSVIGGIFA
jgi:hypothetical protein